jgi:hypothetical protein
MLGKLIGYNQFLTVKIPGATKTNIMESATGFMIVNRHFENLRVICHTPNCSKNKKKNFYLAFVCSS